VVEKLPAPACGKDCVKSAQSVFGKVNERLAVLCCIVLCCVVLCFVLCDVFKASSAEAMSASRYCVA